MVNTIGSLVLRRDLLRRALTARGESPSFQGST